MNLVLLFALTGLLSIPLAIDPSPAWNDFSGTFIRGIATFIVIINVVRTEGRLKALLFVAVATAVVLSFQAMNAYRLGLMTVEGYRAAGVGSGIFANTNDMALHLVTMLPISIAYFFGSRAGAVEGDSCTVCRGNDIRHLPLVFAWRLHRDAGCACVLCVEAADAAASCSSRCYWSVRLLRL